MVFDKTGTLTKGVFKVTAINPQPGFTADALLDYAAHAESFSNHPIAKSIVAAYPGTIRPDRIQHHQEMAGAGLQVSIDSQVVVAGNAELMAAQQIPISPVASLGTVVYLAVDQVYAGHLIISDEVKADAAIEAADIVIMTDEPTKIVTAIKIARKTRKIVRQNIFLALGIKGVFLIMAMFGVATMWEAVFADVGVTLLAVFNAMRVLNTKNL